MRESTKYWYTRILHRKAYTPCRLPISKLVGGLSTAKYHCLFAILICATKTIKNGGICFSLINVNSTLHASYFLQLCDSIKQCSMTRCQWSNSNHLVFINYLLQEKWHTPANEGRFLYCKLHLTTRK
jgi:hypothetical protein